MRNEFIYIPQIYEVKKKLFINENGEQSYKLVRKFVFKKVVKKYIQYLQNQKYLSISFNKNQQEIDSLYQSFLKDLQALKFLKKLNIEFRGSNKCGQQHFDFELIFQYLLNLKELSVVSKDNYDLSLYSQVRNINYLPNLEKLTIDFQSYNNADFSFNFSKSQNLRYLNINFGNYNYIGKHKILKLCQSVCEMKNLNSLFLSIKQGNNICWQGAEAIANCLKYLINLTQLNLFIDSSICIKTYGIKQIIKSISTLENLKILDLDILGDRQIDGGIIGYCLKNLSSIKNLTHLNFPFGGKVKLIKNENKTIGETISNFFQLKYLKLSLHSHMLSHFKGTQAITVGLKQLQNLDELDLTFHDNNNIENEGADALAENLQQLRQLKSLTLVFGEHNQIQKQGSLQLFKSFHQLNLLKNLSITIKNHNQTSKEGTQCLIQSIKQLNLESLSLNIEDQNLTKDELSDCIGQLIYLNSQDELLIKLQEYKNNDQNGVIPFYMSYKFMINSFELTIKNFNIIKKQFNIILDVNEWLKQISKQINVSELKCETNEIQWKQISKSLQNEKINQMIVDLNFKSPEQKIKTEQIKKYLKQKVKRLIHIQSKQ